MVNFYETQYFKHANSITKNYLNIIMAKNIKEVYKKLIHAIHTHFKYYNDLNKSFMYNVFKGKKSINFLNKFKM